MKILNLLSISLLTFSLLNCSKAEQTNLNVEKFEENQVVEIPDIHKELYGIYTGEFSGSYKVSTPDEEYDDYEFKRLSLKINRITKDSVWGQSIVNGNQRPFRGVFNESTKRFVLDEPGSDKYDGRFEVTVSADSLSGKWVAYNKTKVKAPTKTVKLIKKDFVYNPNFMLDENATDLVDWSNSRETKSYYIDPESGKKESYSNSENRFSSDAVFKINGSTKALTEKELKNLRKLDLEIIKNAIYARHGYSFKKETFRNFFEQTDWYIPVSNNVEDDLTPMEKTNIEMLSRFIQYAEDKYDSFGR